SLYFRLLPPSFGQKKIRPNSFSPALRPLTRQVADPKPSCRGGLSAVVGNPHSAIISRPLPIRKKRGKCQQIISKRLKPQCACPASLRPFVRLPWSLGPLAPRPLGPPDPFVTVSHELSSLVTKMLRGFRPYAKLCSAPWPLFLQASS